MLVRVRLNTLVEKDLGPSNNVADEHVALGLLGWCGGVAQVSPGLALPVRPSDVFPKCLEEGVHLEHEEVPLRVLGLDAVVVTARLVREEVSCLVIRPGKTGFACLTCKSAQWSGPVKEWNTSAEAATKGKRIDEMTHLIVDRS